ncbi:hypothetical protein TRVL_10408 [Trypanosoma vivax]|nr:hypothetical protein TRVL_10408 [Trypanosoma vivax]
MAQLRDVRLTSFCASCGFACQSASASRSRVARCREMGRQAAQPSRATRSRSRTRCGPLMPSLVWSGRPGMRRTRPSRRIESHARIALRCSTVPNQCRCAPHWMDWANGHHANSVQEPRSTSVDSAEWSHAQLNNLDADGAPRSVRKAGAKRNCRR